MGVCKLQYFFTYILILYSTGQPVLDCRKHVAFGDSTNLTCSGLQNSVNVNNPVGDQVATCVGRTCAIKDERLTITFMKKNTMLLTLQWIGTDDEGEWTCQSVKSATCTLHVYKTPSCKISSDRSTNNLSLGQELLLNISLRDYYCSKSIDLKLLIRGKSHDVAEFQGPDITNNITSRFLVYSSLVTSSLKGHVELTFNCNEEEHKLNCTGVKELTQREPPYCFLSSDKNSDDLTVGTNLTIQAAIDEYPCKTGIEYALYSGSLMVTEFIRSGSVFYASFEVKPVYLDNQLHLKFTCNNVSATTRTIGFAILQRRVVPFKQSIKIVIGLLTGIVVIAVLFGILIYRNRRHRRSSSNEVTVYNIPTSYNDNEDRYQELIRVVTPNQVQDLDYLTPQPPPDTQYLPVT